MNDTVHIWNRIDWWHPSSPIGKSCECPRCIVTLHCHWLALIAIDCHCIGIQYVSRGLNSKRTGHIIQEDQRLVDACQEWRMVTYYCTALHCRTRIGWKPYQYCTTHVSLDWIGLNWILLLCRFSLVRVSIYRVVRLFGTDQILLDTQYVYVYV